MKFTVHNTPPAKSSPEVMEILLTVLAEARSKPVSFIAISYIAEEEDGYMTTADCFMTEGADIVQCEDAMDMLVKRTEDTLDGIYDIG